MTPTTQSAKCTTQASAKSVSNPLRKRLPEKAIKSGDRIILQRDIEVLDTRNFSSANPKRTNTNFYIDGDKASPTRPRRIPTATIGSSHAPGSGTMQSCRGKVVEEKSKTDPKRCCRRTREKKTRRVYALRQRLLWAGKVSAYVWRKRSRRSFIFFL